jgi:hypothetical protein
MKANAGVSKSGVFVALVSLLLVPLFLRQLPPHSGTIPPVSEESPVTDASPSAAEDRVWPRHADDLCLSTAAVHQPVDAVPSSVGQDATRPGRAAPAWSVPYGDEFWRRPFTGPPLEPGSPKPDMVDLNDIIERVRHAIDSGSDSAAPQVQARTYTASFHTDGLYFSPRRVNDRTPENYNPHGGQRPGDRNGTRIKVTTLWAGRTQTPLVSAPVLPIDWSILGNTAQALLDPRGGLIEHHQAGPDGVEVCWILHAPPAGVGDFEILLGLEGLSHTGGSDQGYLFADATGIDQVRISPAFLVEAHGRRTELQTNPTDLGLWVRVPEALLAQAQFPVVIDPLISPAFDMDEPVLMASMEYQSNASVASNGENHLVIWLDARNLFGGQGSEVEVYGARVASNGTVLDPEGFIIRGGHRPRGTPRVASNGMDYLVVCHEPDDNSQFNVVAIRVSGSGTVLDPDGIRIVPGAWHQFEPAVAADDSGYLVVWQDYRQDDHADIYGAWVTTDGAVPMPEGLAIRAAPGRQRFPSVAASNGHFLVVWEEQEGDNPADIFGARLNRTDGIVDGDAIPISVGANETVNPAVVGGESQFVVAWREQSASAAPWRIVAKRIASNGAVLDPDGLPVSPPEADTIGFALGRRPDGYRVIWQEAVRLPPLDTRYRLVTAQIPPEGTLSDREPFADEVELPRWTLGIAQDARNELVVWTEDRPGSRDVRGFILTRPELAAIHKPFTISTSPNHQEAPCVASNGDQYLVVWRDRRIPTERQLYAARLDTAGRVLDPAGLLIRDEQLLELGPWPQAVGSNGRDFLIVWIDRAPGVTHGVYGTRVSHEGIVLDRPAFPIATFSDAINQPAVASDGQDYLVVFTGGSSVVYGTRVRADGEVLDTPALVLGSGQESRALPAVAGTSSGYLAVWEDSRSGVRQDVYGARVMSDGSRPDGSGRLIRMGGSGPVVAALHQDYLVVWQDYRRQASVPDIYAMRFSSAGQVLDGTGFPVRTSDFPKEFLAAASNGNNWLAAWQEGDQSGFNPLWHVRAARITADGTVPDLDALPVAVSERSEHLPTVAAADGNYLIVYNDHHRRGTGRVKGRFLSFDRPFLSLSRDPVIYVAGSGAGRLDGGARLLSPADQPFHPEHLTIEFTSAAGADDRLEILSEGDEPNQIRVADGTVFYSGTWVGTVSGGTDETGPLLIEFKNDTGLEAVQAVARNVAYRNLSGAPEPGPRVVGWVFTDSAGRSSPATTSWIDVTVPPLITRHPSNHTATAADDVELMVEAIGSTQLDYQWQLNGEDILGANNSVLSLHWVLPFQSGDYRVEVRNAAGMTTSEPARLQVDPEIPTLHYGPADRTVAIGDNTVFAVHATGRLALSYQWQREDVDIPGATQPILTLGGLVPQESGRYSVLIQNATITVTNTATLTVQEDLNPPLLLEARTLGHADQIVLVFSEPVAAASASALHHYAIEPGVGLFEAARDPVHHHVVVLTTAAPLGEGEFTVTATGVTDLVGNPIDQGASAAIDRQVAALLDLGWTTEGFQDDFANPERHPNWTARGYGGDVYFQSNGLLRVAPTAHDPNHLLFEVPYEQSAQEVLARIRILRFGSSDSPRGGIAAGVDPATSQGLNFHFRNEGVLGHHMRLLDDLRAWGPATEFTWETNRWYWLRLRHAPNLDPEQPDLFARIWAGDMRTPEPTGWVTWDYTPDRLARVGFAGIAATSNSGLAEFEVDYILIKARGLPPITVAPAQLHRPPPHLEQPRLTAGAQLTVTVLGEPGDRYLLQVSVDLEHWTDLDEVLNQDGHVELQIEETSGHAFRFFRLLLIP